MRRWPSEIFYEKNPSELFYEKAFWALLWEDFELFREETLSSFARRLWALLWEDLWVFLSRPPLSRPCHLLWEDCLFFSLASGCEKSFVCETTIWSPVRILSDQPLWENIRGFYDQNFPRILSIFHWEYNVFFLEKILCNSLWRSSVFCLFEKTFFSFLRRHPYLLWEDFLIVSENTVYSVLGRLSSLL